MQLARKQLGTSPFHTLLPSFCQARLGISEFEVITAQAFPLKSVIYIAMQCIRHFFGTGSQTAWLSITLHVVC